MECVIDTNVIINEMIEDAELHDSAVNGLEKIKRILIPTVVVEELVYALKNLSISDEIIKNKIEELLKTDNIEIISINSLNFQEATKLIIKHKVSFKRFNDKLILSVAKIGQIPLFTFDRDLMAQCRKENVEVFS
jgi:predicted nucleic acid-binding protein